MQVAIFQTRPSIGDKTCIGNFVVLARNTAAAVMEQGLEGQVCLEINVSCPNLSTGAQWGKNADDIASIVSKCSEAIREANIPLIVKLSPNVKDIKIVARSAIEAGASGLTISNTYVVKDFRLDKNGNKEKVYQSERCALAGAYIFPFVVENVRKVRELVDEMGVNVPIIHSGGVVCKNDAKQTLEAGASFIQVCSGAVRDRGIIERINNEFAPKKERNINRR